MSAIIPFESNLPARRSGGRIAGINKDVLGSGSAGFPTLSIKGKVFTLVKGSERKILTRIVDDEEEPVQSLQLSVVRANTKYRVFYADNFVEGESDGKKPTCFSHDGTAPDRTAVTPQAKKCQVCPQNVWGVRDGKGTACSVKTRLAVIDPIKMGEPFLLNVPAASRKSFAQIVEAADARNKDYNEMVMRISFDKEAPSPKLVFKPVGWLPDAEYAKVLALYDDETVKDMVGVPHGAADAAVPVIGEEEVDAAIAASNAVRTAKATPALRAPEPVMEDDDVEDVVAKAPEKVVKPAKPAKAVKATPVADDMDSLLADMDSLLSNPDD